MKSIGIRIKTQRKLKGLTQEGLAHQMGTTKAAVSRWETDRNAVAANKLQLLADILSVDAEWILTGKSPGIESSLNDFVFWAKLYPDICTVVGNGSVKYDKKLELIPIPSRFVKYQNDKSQIYCVAVKGDSMSPVLYDGSIIAVNPANKCIKDGRMYLIQQNDLLRVKIVHQLPDKLIFRSYNKDFEDEKYNLKDTAIRSSMRILGEVFWYSSLPYHCN
ncbi:XRE family transcriptional regulator [Aliivibrio fischeri]|uniref:XRE family transcriptional regulator n=1 Tax=Aliivibrio fischeri TaxID=668 RepID=UPI00084C6034|nr:XRE family transcriptional regulator [Aliivibrio fischeri]MUJ27985.1 helix-turn-helix domain-containing protein [Aliivibrio fischeri]OED52805.1 hypothetical protein BEI47_18950 [Aliivibrio fischeri]